MKNFKIATLLAVIFTVGLVGCVNRSNIKHLTRAETIAAIKECEEGGTRAHLQRHGITDQIIDVICLPKETAN